MASQRRIKKKLKKRLKQVERSALGYARWRSTKVYDEKKTCIDFKCRLGVCRDRKDSAGRVRFLAL